MPSPTKIEVPFLVVGAGPVGMMESLLLANLGRPSLIIDRRAGAQTAPAAHVVSARTFEIARQLGLDMAALEAASLSPEMGGSVRFVTRLAGEEIGHLRFEQQGDDCLTVTPTPLRNLSQHRLEPLLADEVRKRDAIDLRYRHEWLRCEVDDDGVTSFVQDLERDETIQIRSRFLIGADGAGSAVRRSIGIEMEGPPRLQSFMMIHFEADLREIIQGRPGVLHFLVDPEAGGTFVAHDPERDWVYMRDFDPDVESIDDYDDDRCRALVCKAIGRDVPLQILHRGPWHMSAQVAQAMRRDRVFLVGDAAHRFPPTGGLGLNSGVQDAQNLTWKLSAVEDGWASPSLLDTYGAERLPVAHENTQQSLSNALKMILLAQALGTDVEPTSARVESTLADPKGRVAVEQAIKAQAEHFDMLGLQLGFRYDEGALVPEPDPPERSTRTFRPTAHPGARLPHVWLEGGGSTLDLVDHAGMTLLSVGGHEAWAKALSQIDGIPIRQVRIGLDASPRDASWISLCALHETGALLVRPDQHVAWRATHLPEDPSTQLADALDQILGAPR